MPIEDLNPYASRKGPESDLSKHELTQVEVGMNRQQFAALSFGSVGLWACILWTLDRYFPLDDVHFLVTMSIAIAIGLFCVLVIILVIAFPVIGR